jgi:hypothetical protein
MKQKVLFMSDKSSHVTKSRLGPYVCEFFVQLEVY